VIDGVLFRFIDTAGIRDASDEIEKLGIERAFAKIREAEVVLGVVDCSDSESSASDNSNMDSIAQCVCEDARDGQMSDALENAKMIIEKVDLKSQKLLLLCNKIDAFEGDLACNKNVIDINSFVSCADNACNNVKTLKISAKEGFGLDELRNELGEMSGISSTSDNLVTSARHAQALRSAAESLHEVENGLGLLLPTDLIAEDLRSALNALGSITGEISTDEVLGEIFGKFCIGK